MLAAKARKAGSASEDTSYSKAAVFDRETGLYPLNVTDVRISDDLNQTSQKSIKLRERVMAD